MELVNDSKGLSPAERERVRAIVERCAIAYRVVHLPPRVIDAINILQASILAMQMAVDGLGFRPSLLLVDGNRFSDYGFCPYRCVVKGDARFLSIAAASILAKTHRDELMMNLAEQYPHYDWGQNKGYPTRRHVEALREFGPSPWHRASFHVKE